MAEIILGRLKFKWQGDWQSSTAYIKDDIVRYGANTYVATENHTSNASDFYADLTANKWNLMNSGFEWKGDWSAGAGYFKFKVNDIVKYGANVYLCKVGHTAGSVFETDLNASRWEILTTGVANRGVWQNTGRYALNDIVTYGSGVYICTEDHAADESTDTAPDNSSYWQKLADGMQFEGVWDATTEYQRGDVIRFGGYTYYAKQGSVNVRPGEGLATYTKTVTVANPGGYGNKYYIDGVLTPNVELYERNTYIFDQSDNSNDTHPLYISTSKNGHFDGGNYNYWLEGVTWWLDGVKQNSFADYVSGFALASNRYVQFTVPVGAPTVYPVCANHSGMYDDGTWTTLYSELYWDILNKGMSYVNEHSPAIGFEYKPGEVTLHSGNTYVANKITTTTPPSGDWDLVARGFKYRNDWADNTTYYPGDIVNWGGYLYLCVKKAQDRDQPNPLTTEYWAVYHKGLQWRGDWDVRLNFGVGDLTRYGGKVYICTFNNYDDGSTSRDPESEQFFELFVDGMRWRGDWDGSPIDPYVKGDIVSHGGRAYICVNSYTSDSSLAGMPPDANWEVFSDGVAWEGTWAAGTEYKINDIVEHAQSSYISIAEKNIGNTPGSSPTKWSILAQGDISSPMTATGDMIYRNASGAVERLPIGDPGAILTVNNGLPTWGHRTPQTEYYVSLEGSDSNDGRTASTSWRTLEHACEQTYGLGQCKINIAAGTYTELCPMKIGRSVVVEGNGLGAVTITPETTADKGYGVGISKDGSTPNANSDVFQLNNGSRLRNIVFRNFSTGSVMTALDPGYGPDDTSVWITSQSPYVQNCTAFANEGTGMLIDGALHNGGYKSAVANDWTQINSDGVGIHVKSDARVELVSVFTYYCNIGYLAESGGKIRALVGNNSYGEYGAVARGFSQSEAPLTGKLQLADETLNSISNFVSDFHIHSQTRDLNGNLYLCGHTNPTGSDISATWSNTASYPLVIRMNPQGAIEWIYQYDTHFGSANSIESIDGEELYVGGTVYKGGTNNGFIMKLSISGEIQWDKDIGDLSSITAIAVDADDVYGGGDHATAGAGIVKLNPAGQELWAKTLNYNDSSLDDQLQITSMAYTVNPTTSTDTYALEGDATTERCLYVTSFDPINRNTILTRINDAGGTEESFQYDNVYVEQLRLDSGNGDGIYFMAVGHYYISASNWNAWSARISVLGDIEWQAEVQTVAENSSWRDVVPLGNDVYLAGYVNASTNTVNRAMISRYRSNGALDWISTFRNSTNLSLTGISLDGVNLLASGWDGANSVLFNVQKDKTNGLGTVTSGSYTFNTESYPTPQNTRTTKTINAIDSANVALGSSTVGFTLNQSPTQTRTVSATRAGFAGIGRGVTFTVNSLNRQPKEGSVFQIEGDDETYFVIGIANYTAPAFTTGQYPNSQAILQANRTWLQKEVIGYVNQTYNVGYTYDKAKCQRDYGYILEGAGYDIAFGTNYWAVTNGLAYQRASASVVTNQQSAITNASFTNLKSLVNLLAGLQADTTSTNRNNAYFDEVIDIFNNGTGSADALTFPIPSGASVNITNARDQLQANKSFLQAEVLEYINNNYNSVYLAMDQAKCSRDVGYIIDGLTHDIVYGGNLGAKTNAEAYFVGAASQLAAGQATATAAAYNFLAGHISDVVQGNVIASPQQVGVSQDTSSGNASATEATTLDGLVQIIEDVITAGDLTGLPADSTPSVAWAASALQTSRQDIINATSSLITQSIAYVDSLIFDYDQTTCERDVGLIVDAIVNDLDRNTNGDSIDAAYSYYSSGSALIAITTQKTETLAAINHLKDIIGNALNQTAPATTYSSEVQTTGLPGAEAGGITLADTNMGVLYNILNLGRSSAPEKTGYGSAQISLDPSIPSNKTPNDNTFVVFREAFSQVRMTGHDFLDVGSGGFADTNYPVIIQDDYTQKPDQAREVDTESGGRVFYVTTDQDGDFRVGDYFKVEQSTGRATLSSEEFDLTGLNELQLGSITAGKQGATINEFSTDGTMADNSDTAVPTERAVVTYVSAKIDERFESFGGTSHIAIPVGTTAQRPSPAGTGYFRYNSDTASLEVYGASGTWEPAGSIRWQIATADFTAAKGEGWLVDSSAGPVVVTLPAAAQIGDTIRIIDKAGTFNTNSCTINRNGHNIMGLAQNLTLGVEHAGIGLVYADATAGWKMIEVL